MCRVLTVTRLNRLAIRIFVNRDIGNEIDRRIECIGDQAAVFPLSSARRARPASVPAGTVRQA